MKKPFPFGKKGSGKSPMKDELPMAKGMPPKTMMKGKPPMKKKGK